MLQTKLTREQERWNVLVSLLHHNVPRFIAHIKNRGGVQEEEWEWLRNSEDTSLDYPKGVMANADVYLVCPSNIEDFKRGLFVLVKAIALLSFVPGGIHIFDLHFCSEMDGFVKLENDGSET